MNPVVKPTTPHPPTSSTPHSSHTSPNNSPILYCSLSSGSPCRLDRAGPHPLSPRGIAPLLNSTLPDPAYGHI